MEFVRFFLLAFLLLSVAQCDYWGEYNGDSIDYSYLPPTVLGNFEGTYTSTGSHGYYNKICQDDDVIYGAYDQAGVFYGNVTDNTASGIWYEAGTGSCVTGTFEITLNTDGFSGFYTCGQASTKYNWTETKKSPFRPTDDECGFIDLSSSASISGRYEDSEGLAKDICFTESGRATISYLYYDENNQLQKGYFEGKSYYGGKLFIGTWYSLFPSAGADLYYLSSDGNVKGYYWTGLDGTKGNTVINPGEFRQPNLHGPRNYFGPIAKTTSANCDDYSSIKTKVLNNLVPDNDDDLYYFITSDFNFIVDDDGGDDDNAVDDEDYSLSEASQLYWLSLPLLLLAFVF